MKISKKWLRIAEIYKRFAHGYADGQEALKAMGYCDSYKPLNFSDEAALAMYKNETFGEPMNDEWNGFALGKRWMDITIAMWKEDLKTGMMLMTELRPDFPDWFLKKVGVLE